jgi:hypothetical protein
MHSEHPFAPSFLWNIPFEQGEHSTAPAAEYVPSAQLEQKDEPVNTWNNPDAHIAHMIAPEDEENIPVWHFSQSVEAKLDWKVPAEQALHELAATTE